ncbi:hypothetical protein S40288_00308 [Stachybotrys chartarum IBT 40288]|nr:hypothetical protein S40288_00308 [Stachybotrys chartarum IBT 40288]
MARTYPAIHVATPRAGLEIVCRIAWSGSARGTAAEKDIQAEFRRTISSLAMTPELGPIMVVASKARRRLRELCIDIDETTKHRQGLHDILLDHEYVTECLEQFNIWAGILGVFQLGGSSLDSRLYTHDLVREVLRLLKQLDGFAESLRGIIDGSREHKTWTRTSTLIQPGEMLDLNYRGDEDSDVLLTPETDEGSQPIDEIFTESQDLYLLINESVTSLLRFSIQKSTIIQNFYPAAAQNHALLERLAKANTQRRQWVWYRKRRREKLLVDFSRQKPGQVPFSYMGEHQEDDEEEEEEMEEKGELCTREEAASSVLSGTKATTFVSFAPSAVVQSVVPDTVFGHSSRTSADERRIMVPSLPTSSHDRIKLDEVVYKICRPLDYIHASNCPFCDYPPILHHRYTEDEVSKLPVETFGKHLGRHLEQLALFAIPMSDLIDEEYDASDRAGAAGDDNVGSEDENSDIDGVCDLPESLTRTQDLAMKWQSPQDFTPPLEDFDTEEADLLPDKEESSEVRHGTLAQTRIERAYKVGWTPLMVACQVDSLEIVTMLLDAGANPAPKSPMLKTALGIAKGNGRTEIVEYPTRRLGVGH